MRGLTAVILCGALVACATQPPKAPVAAQPAMPVATPASAAATPPAGPPPNDNLNAVTWTQTALEHDLVYREVYRNATEKLAAALKDPTWDALPTEARKQPLPRKMKPAVIVDIDETVLDNSPYEARLIRDGKTGDAGGFAQWSREKQAKALPGAVEFAQFAAKRGVTVFYVSNRSIDLAEPTLENLRSAGFPIAANENVFLGLGLAVDGCVATGSDKGCRRELIGRTHRVLMQFGDQVGDFVNITSNTVQGRQAAMAPYADWIGTRWFVLPNPMYGSWQPALYGNDRNLSPDLRRKATIEALRTD